MRHGDGRLEISLNSLRHILCFGHNVSCYKSVTFSSSWLLELRPDGEINIGGAARYYRTAHERPGHGDSCIQVASDVGGYTPAHTQERRAGGRKTWCRIKAIKLPIVHEHRTAHPDRHFRAFIAGHADAHLRRARFDRHPPAGVTIGHPTRIAPH